MKNIFIISLVFMLSISIVSAGDWTMFGGDAEHSGVSLISFAPDYNEYSDIGLINEINLGTEIRSTPVVVGNMMYVNGKDFHIYNMDTGRDITFNNVGMYPDGSREVYWINSIPAVADGKVCYNDYYNVYCRDASTGVLLWQFNETFGEGYFPKWSRFEHSSPIISNGKVWIAPKANYNVNPLYIYAFDLNNGDVLVQKQIKDQYNINDKSPQFIITPSISEGVVYFSIKGSEGYWGQVYAINETTGDEIWHYDINIEDGYMENNPVTVSGDKVIVGVHKDHQGLVFESYLLALNKNDGNFLWRADLPEFKSLEHLSPVVYAGKVLIGADNRMKVFQYESETTYQGKLYAFDLATGGLVWESVTVNNLIDSFSVADSKILVGTTSELGKGGATDIYAFSTVDGALLWNEANTASDEYVSSPSIVNDKVYFATSSGIVKEFITQTESTKTITVNPGAESVVDARAEADTILRIYGKSLSLSSSGSVIVKKYLDESAALGGSGQPEFGLTKLNKYITIDADVSVTDNMDYTTIEIYYTDDEAKAAGILDESKLRLYDWDAKTQTWIVMANSGVDSVNNFVYGDTTHFSAFGAGGLQEDSDGDGIANIEDNCASVSNAGQEDSDGDGIGDACDNCAGVSNGNQDDIDSDGIGNACDIDDDGDEVLDEIDNCASVSNAGQEDSDGDGIGDACDNCAGVSNSNQADKDKDGSGDVCDICSLIKGANSDNALNNLNDFKDVIVNSLYANNVKNPMKSNINGAIGALERGQTKNAVSKLDALISTAERLNGRGKIAQGTKDGIVQCANGIKAQI